MSSSGMNEGNRLTVTTIMQSVNVDLKTFYDVLSSLILGEEYQEAVIL